MICLDSTDVIEGGASIDAVVDYQLHGLVGTTFTQLAAGVMNTTLTAVLYTAGAAISVVSIILVNKHSSAVNITLCLDPANGGNPRYLIPKTISLGVGYSLHTDGARLTIIDANGGLVSGLNVSDTAYGAGWNGVTMIAPSKNAVYDEVELRTKAATVIVDNRLVRGDGGSRGVQESTIIISDNGEMTNPSQPSFSASVNTSQLNVTGDNTLYSCTGAFWTERFDQNNDFSGGIFTAPVTGKYLFAGIVDFTGITAGMDGFLFYLATSNATYTISVGHPANMAYQGTQLSVSFACYVDMDVSDTAYLQGKVRGGAKIADLTATYNHFQGGLIC